MRFVFQGYQFPRISWQLSAVRIYIIYCIVSPTSAINKYNKNRVSTNVNDDHTNTGPFSLLHFLFSGFSLDNYAILAVVFLVFLTSLFPYISSLR